MAIHIDPAAVIRRIGNMPIGDPAAMRSHAARLHQDADQLAQLAITAARRARSTQFEGPAAERFKAEIEDCAREIAGRAAHLHAAASRLERAAADVAAAQASWRVRFHQIESQLADAAARAAGRH